MPAFFNDLFNNARRRTYDINVNNSILQIQVLNQLFNPRCLIRLAVNIKEDAYLKVNKLKPYDIEL